MTDIVLTLTPEEARLLCIELEAVLATDFPEPDPESDWYDEQEHGEWRALDEVYGRLYKLISS